jgi:hypothetical protein
VTCADSGFVVFSYWRQELARFSLQDPLTVEQCLLSQWRCIAALAHALFFLVVQLVSYQRAGNSSFSLSHAHYITTGIMCAASFGASSSSIVAGLWGYNPALALVALFGIFYVPSWKVGVLAICGGILSCFVTAYLATILKPLGIPQLTLAFSFTAFMFILIQSSLVSIFAVPLDRVTYPEEHLRKVRLIRHILSNLKRKNRDGVEKDG